jgi:hypothetical protein
MRQTPYNQNQNINYSHVNHVAATKTIGASIDAYPLTTALWGAGELVDAYNISKSMIFFWLPSVELKQLSVVTSGTSFGSAKVISAHCLTISYNTQYHLSTSPGPTLYSDAPCCASSMT